MYKKKMFTIIFGITFQDNWNRLCCIYYILNNYRKITSKEFSKKIQANLAFHRMNFKLCHFKSTTFSSMLNIMILEIGNSSSLTIPVIQGMSWPSPEIIISMRERLMKELDPCFSTTGPKGKAGFFIQYGGNIKKDIN